MRPSKTYDYIIVLKKPSLRVIDWISQLMLLTAFVLLIYTGLTQTAMDSEGNKPYSYQVLEFVFSAIIAGWWVFCRLQQRQYKTVYYRFALMIAAWGLYYFPGGKPLTIIYLVAALLEKPIKVAPELAFDDNEVVLNSFPKKRYLWDDINNLILKDGLLTVDLKSNKLLQREVDADVSPADEKDFNDFCTAQLKRTAAN